MPFGYLTEQRIRRAKQLLRNTKLSVQPCVADYLIAMIVADGPSNNVAGDNQGDPIRIADITLESDLRRAALHTDGMSASAQPRLVIRGER